MHSPTTPMISAPSNPPSPNAFPLLVAINFLRHDCECFRNGKNYFPDKMFQHSELDISLYAAVIKIAISSIFFPALSVSSVYVLQLSLGL